MGTAKGNLTYTQKDTKFNIKNLAYPQSVQNKYLSYGSTGHFGGALFLRIVLYFKKSIKPSLSIPLPKLLNKILCTSI